MTEWYDDRINAHPDYAEEETIDKGRKEGLYKNGKGKVLLQTDAMDV